MKEKTMKEKMRELELRICQLEYEVRMLKTPVITTTNNINPYCPSEVRKHSPRNK